VYLYCQLKHRESAQLGLCSFHHTWLTHAQLHGEKKLFTDKIGKYSSQLKSIGNMREEE
jgi:hypothetical protein